MTQPARPVNVLPADHQSADEDRVQVVISDDGTKIAGRVHGQGPPLVLVHGGLGDGEFAWRFLLPFLVDRFTCYAMSTRGRGLSGDNTDHSHERQFEDVAAFAKSIGEPVGVFGHSAGARWVLGGAAHAAVDVRGVALYEPPFPVTDRLRLDDERYGRVRAAVAENRLTDAVRLAISEVIGLNDDEQAIFSVPPGSEIAEANIRVAAKELSEISLPLDDAILGHLTMPVLVMQGGLSGDHFKESVRHLDERLDHAVPVEVAGAGHIGPVTAPKH